MRNEYILSYFDTLNKGSQKPLSAKANKDIKDKFSKFYDHSNSEMIINLDIQNVSDLDVVGCHIIAHAHKDKNLMFCYSLILFSLVFSVIYYIYLSLS